MRGGPHRLPTDVAARRRTRAAECLQRRRIERAPMHTCLLPWTISRPPRGSAHVERGYARQARVRTFLPPPLVAAHTGIPESKMIPPRNIYQRNLQRRGSIYSKERFSRYERITKYISTEEFCCLKSIRSEIYFLPSELPK